MTPIHEARADLAAATCPRPDSWYAERWGWDVDAVAILRVGMTYREARAGSRLRTRRDVDAWLAERVGR